MNTKPAFRPDSLAHAYEQHKTIEELDRRSLGRLTGLVGAPQPIPSQCPPTEPNRPTLLTMPFGRVAEIQQRDSSGKPIVYAVKVNGCWYITRDLALYEQVRDLRAKDCMIRVVFHEAPCNGKRLRLIDSVERVAEA